MLEWSKLGSARRATEWRKMMGATSVSALLPTNGYQSGSDLLDTALGSQEIELRSGITRVCNFKTNAQIADVLSRLGRDWDDCWTSTQDKEI